MTRVNTLKVEGWAWNDVFATLMHDADIITDVVFIIQLALMASNCQSQVSSMCLSSPDCNGCFCNANMIQAKYTFGVCSASATSPTTCYCFGEASLSVPVSDCTNVCPKLVSLYDTSLSFIVITNFVLILFAITMASAPGEFQNLLTHVGSLGFLVVFVSVATNPQRLLRLALDDDKNDKDHRKRINFALSVFYFLFSTVPQLSVQVVYLQIFGFSSTALVSMIFTVYSVFSNLTYRCFQMCTD